MTLAFARKANLVLSMLGAITFAILFLYMTLSPRDFDRRVNNFAVARVQERVDHDLNMLAQSRVIQNASRLAGAFSKDLQQRVDQFRAAPREGLNRFIRDVLAAECLQDCERRQQARNAADSFYKRVLARYGVALDRLQKMAAGHYQDVMEQLRHDLRIFAGSSFLAFVFAVGLSLLRGQAARHLLPVSMALTTATILAIIWYVFGQDWVIAVIFNDYWGWAYAAVICTLTGLMLDIALNKARITSLGLNAIGNAIGKSFAFMPC
jgi:hypothetical protein